MKIPVFSLVRLGLGDIVRLTRRFPLHVMAILAMSMLSMEQPSAKLGFSGIAQVVVDLLQVMISMAILTPAFFPLCRFMLRGDVSPTSGFDVHDRRVRLYFAYNCVFGVVLNAGFWASVAAFQETAIPIWGAFYVAVATATSLIMPGIVVGAAAPVLSGLRALRGHAWRIYLVNMLLFLLPFVLILAVFIVWMLVWRQLPGETASQRAVAIWLSAFSVAAVGVACRLYGVLVEGAPPYERDTAAATAVGS